MRAAIYQPRSGYSSVKGRTPYSPLSQELYDQVDTFHADSNALGHFPDASGSFSFVRTVRGADYDLIRVNPGTRILGSRWAAAWLTGVAQGLAPHGEMLIQTDSSAGRSGRAGMLQAWLGRALETPVRQDGGATVIKAYQFTPPPVSTVGVFMADSASWVARLAEASQAEESGALAAGQWTEGFPNWTVTDRCSLRVLRADFLDGTLGAISRTLVYSVLSSGIKSHALSIILEQLFGRRCEVTWVDLGSGPGLVGTEIALHLPVRVINYDKSVSQSLLGEQIRAGLPRNHLGDRVTTVTSPLEIAELSETVDAVSLLTSLCYIPHDQRLKVLRSAWDALAPGGALIILENLKAPSYKRDQSLMFTAPEIEQLLDHFSNKGLYFHPVSGLPLDVH